MRTSLAVGNGLRHGVLCLMVCLGLWARSDRVWSQTTKAAAPYRPRLYFGTVNFNDQLTRLDAWKQTASRVDGMLLHLHFFVRHMSAPGSKTVNNAPETIRKIAPNLAGKSNIIELTYHIHDVASSPEEIARTHARNIEEIEKTGIPIAGVNVDWILSGFEVQLQQTPRLPGEGEDAYFTRILNGVIAKSARYVAAFRAAGRREKLIAVFPPLYLDEGSWTNARKTVRPGITVSRVLSGLFDSGFDGFTADSPYFVLSNPTYKANGYYEALRSIERTCHRRGKEFGFIINGDNKFDGAEYDSQFAKTSLEALDMILSAGLQPDSIVVESWYKGPFQLVPETRADTFTSTVLQIAERLKRGSPVPRGNSLVH